MVGEDRVQALEERVETLEQRLRRLESRAVASMAPPPARTAPPATGRQPSPAATEPWRPLAPSRPATRRRIPELPRPALPSAAAPDLEQLFGGRVLAWLGGAAIFAGLAFLLALAIGNGWLGETARTLLAGAASLGLVATGVALHERRGRTEAARAALGAGLAGLFLTLAVATRAYDLVPAAVALPLALATGAAGTALAIRWHARAIAGLGLVGAILSPALTGAPADSLALAFLVIAVAASTAVLLWQRWNWLGVAAFVAAAPQCVAGAADASNAGAVVVLAGFGALHAVAALGYEVRVPAPRLRGASAFLAVLNAVVLAVAGYVMLDSRLAGTAAIAWLAGLALAHAGAAIVLQRRAPAAADARHLCLVLAVLLADAGFVLAVDGPARAIGWAAASVAFAALGRRLRAAHAVAADGGHAPGLSDLGLGGHVGLALVQAVAQLDGGATTAAGVDGDAIAALSALAAGCLVSARLAEDGRHRIRVALDVTGLAAVAGCAALALDGAALTAAWALEAVALAGIAKRRDDAVARIAALVHLGAAAAWALYDQAAPGHLLDGGVALRPAALALAAVAGSALLIARATADERTRDTLRVGAGLALLHLASLAAVAVTPGPGAEDALGLGARQQGQLQLSALWALTGAGALVAGLHRDVRELRVAALLLLAVATAKVFAFDLSALEAGYRVGSFIAIGVVLLAGSFAYARLRPEPLADLREVPLALR